MEAGQSLYKDAKYMIQYFKGSLACAREASQKREHLIRIGTSLIGLMKESGKAYADIWMETGAVYIEAGQYYAKLMSAMIFTIKTYIAEMKFSG